jgi:hypothetical protein
MRSGETLNETEGFVEPFLLITLKQSNVENCIV